MTTVLWLAGVLACTALAMPLLRLDALRELPRTARLATSFLLGQFFNTLLLWAASALHIGWSRALVWVAFALCAAASWTQWRELAPARPRTRGALALVALPLALLAYGIATARLTCGDLLFFWGPKAQRFFVAGKIDTDFLRFPHYFLMHSDYPPLVPLTYVSGSLAAHRLSWWGTLWLTFVLVAAMTAILHGVALRELGAARAMRFAALLAAVVTCGIVAGRAAGAADTMLYAYEALALVFLTFLRPSRGATMLASLALAAAVLTKVEGAAFAAVAIAAFALTSRRLRESLVLALAPGACLGLWLAFATHHQLLDSYRRGGQSLHLANLGEVLRATVRQASYGAAWLPWIAVVVPLLLGTRWKRAAIPLLVAAGSFAYTIYFYLHETDPSWWIRTSAERVLLTTLIALVAAAAAAAQPADSMSVEGTQSTLPTT